MNKEFKSPADYAKTLVDTLREQDGTEDDDMPLELINYWCEYVYEAATKSYNDYLVGKREDYRLDDTEMNEAYEKAGLRYTEDIINSLLDKDMIQAGVRKDGEIVYSLTQKGKNYEL